MADSTGTRDMRNIDPDSEENQRQTRDNGNHVKVLKFLAKNPNKCKRCGYPISPDSEYCGECLCEEDGL